MPCVSVDEVHLVIMSCQLLPSVWASVWRRLQWADSISRPGSVPFYLLPVTRFRFPNKPDAFNVFPPNIISAKVRAQVLSHRTDSRHKIFPLSFWSSRPQHENSFVGQRLHLSTKGHFNTAVDFKRPTWNYETAAAVTRPTATGRIDGLVVG